MSTGATFASLMHLDAQLAKHGVHSFDAWWRELLGRFYSGPALTLAVNAGRGSVKSGALYKLAIHETIYGAWDIAPGERHWANLTSRLKDEAGKGTTIISRWLALLGVRHTAIDGVIELTDMPRGIRITAASVGGNSGWRSYFNGNDETGKWATDGSASVDAVEVLASKRAMTATHARARHVIVSSPFVDSGPFYEMIYAGSNETALVASAPTWVVTGGRISEATTRKLEPNERIHAREYGASFAVEWEHGYFSGLIEPCVAPWTSRPYQPGRRYVCAIDPGFQSDLFGIAIASADGDRVVIDRIEAIVPPRDGSGLSPIACLQRTRAIAAEYQCGKVWTDQHHAASLVELAARERVKLEPVPWTASNKGEKFEVVRTLMRDKRLVLPNDKPLIREFQGISTRLLSSGHEQIRGRSGHSDDRVSCVVIAASTVAIPTPGSKWARALEGKGEGDIFKMFNDAAIAMQNRARFGR